MLIVDALCLNETKGQTEMTTLNNAAANLASKLIAGVMNAEASGNNRQAQLVLYMFDNEVSYTIETLSPMFKVKGSDRTEIVNKLLRGLSDDYVNVADELARLVEKKKAEKEQFSDAEGLQIEAHKGKLRAAQLLFTRAASAVVHLRHVDAGNLKVMPNGALRWYQQARDKDGKPEFDKKGGAISVAVTVSSNALVRMSEKTLATLFNKSPRKTTPTASNPVAGGITEAAKAINAKLSTLLANHKGIPDLSKDEEKETEKLFKSLFKAMFADDKGDIDVATVRTWIADEFKIEFAKASKPADKAA